MGRKKTTATRPGSGGSGVPVDLEAHGLDGLPPLRLRPGMPVDEQARDYVNALDVDEGRRTLLPFRVMCAIAERLPKHERPDWFETDDEILRGIEHD